MLKRSYGNEMENGLCGGWTNLVLSLSRECPLQHLSIRVKQVLAEVVIARSERILGGNTEVKAFVLSVHSYI